MSVFGYQSDLKEPTSVTPVNPQIESKLLKIEADHIADQIFYTPNRNSYTQTSGNLILNGDIRLKLTAGIGRLPPYPVMSLPVPARFQRITSLPGTVFSNDGVQFRYSIDRNGLVTISGEITQVNQEIIFDFKPYLAEYPLQYNSLP